MKKKIMLGVSVVSCFFVAGLTLMAGRNLNSFVRTRSSSYSLTLNSANTPTGLTDSYQDKVTGVVKTMGDYDATFDFVNAKTASGKFVQLAPHGRIINFGADDKNFNGVNYAAFTGSGSLSIKTAKAGQAGGAYLNKPIALSSSPVAVPVSNYFELEAGDNGAVIETLELTYSCDATDYDIKALDGTYTGVGSDTSTWQLDVNNGACTIKSLDKASNLQLDGTAEMLSATRAQCTFTYMGQPIQYVVDVSADKHSLTYVSKSGTYAAGVAEINFDRVYNIQDFESFTATGDGYTSTRGASSKYSTTGLRSAIYADYYGSNTVASTIGGSGWSLMGSADFLTYNSSKGHNGSKTGVFKGNGNSLRYISMNEFYGVPEVIGKGSTLSFWARGPWANTNFNTDATVNATIKLYAFFASQLTPSNQQTAREEHEFVIPVGSDWTEYAMDLTPGRAYFGFGFLCKQSGTTYTAIDDVKIYTASPYAEYVPPAAVTGVELDDDAIELSVGGTSTLTATVSPNNATNKAVTWTSSDESVATVEDGVVTGVAAGNATITVTTVDGGFTDTCTVTVTSIISFPSGVFVGNANVNSNNLPLLIALGDQTNKMAAVRIANNTDAEPTDVTFNNSTGAISITTTGSYSSLKFGTITGTYNPGTHAIENISCAGAIKTYISNNGSITATATSHYWDCNGTQTELRDLFKRRYGDPWQTNDKTIDRIMRDTTHYVSGSAVTNNGWTGGRVALNLYNDMTPASVGNIGFWVYNPSGSDITLRQWIYKGASFGSNAEIGSVTAKANGWSFCVMGFTTATIYNFQIADFNSTGVNLTYDDIFLY